MNAENQMNNECTCEYEEPLTTETLVSDFPIFAQLDRTQLFRLTGAIAFWLGDKVELLPRDWEELGIPPEAEQAVEQLSEEQLQQCLLPYLTSRLQSLPVPCGCCGGEGREPESGFCPRCDQQLNSPAAYQIFSQWEDWHDPEHINGVSNY